MATPSPPKMPISSPTKMMTTSPARKEIRWSIHAHDAKHLYTAISKYFNWGDLSNDVVMDIGLGPERNCCNLLVTLYPRVKQLISIDKYSANINRARARSPHPRVSYEVADIWDWFSLESWQGQMDKLVSVNCFNCVYDQMLAFSNAWRLLKPGGQAGFQFDMQSGYYDWFKDLAENPKWEPYYDGKSQFIPPSHDKNYSNEYYRCLLTEVGFEVLYCEEEEFTHSYPSDESLAESAVQACIFNDEIPYRLLKDFKRDAFDAFVRNNKRDGEGKPCLLYRSCTALVRKPEMLSSTTRSRTDC